MFNSRRFKSQWFLMPVLIVVMWTLLYKKKQQADEAFNVRTKTSTSSAFLLTSVSSVKYVTKSLKELGKMDEVNKFVVVLNQVPFCGAEVLIFLLQKMQGINSFRHVPLAPRDYSSKNQQEMLVDEVYNVMRNEAVPLSFHRQCMRFVNFSRFGKQSPTYINLIRDPADKALSRSHSNKNNNKTDLIQCLIQDKSNCTNEKINPEHLTVPYFCGTSPKCLCDQTWALDQAKRNIERFYPVVGVLEELNATLEVLQKEVPYFFKGVVKLFEKKLCATVARKTLVTTKPTIKKKIERILRQEFQFYEWVRGRLFNQLKLGSYH